MSEFEKWLTIIASIITIISFLFGVFIGRKRGIKITQQQKQKGNNKDQYQKQTFEG